MTFKINRTDEIQPSSQYLSLWGYLDRNRLCFSAEYLSRKDYVRPEESIHPSTAEGAASSHAYWLA